MSIGAALIGIALLAIVVAYLARPFRPAAAVGTDRAIESWVAQVEAERLGREGDLDRPEQVRQVPPSVRHEADADVEPADRETLSEAINFCPQCGRLVDEGDRFCSGCGTRLRRDVL